MHTNVDGVQVQHGVDPVEHIKHQFALLLDGTSIGVHGAGVIPVLQEMHKVCPLPLTLDFDIHLVIGAADRSPGISESVGLASDGMSSVGMNGVKK